MILERLGHRLKRDLPRRVGQVYTVDYQSDTPERQHPGKSGYLSPSETCVPPSVVLGTGRAPQDSGMTGMVKNYPESRCPEQDLPQPPHVDVSPVI